MDPTLLTAFAENPLATGLFLEILHDVEARVKQEVLLVVHPPDLREKFEPVLPPDEGHSWLMSLTTLLYLESLIGPLCGPARGNAFCRVVIIHPPAQDGRRRIREAALDVSPPPHAIGDA